MSSTPAQGNSATSGSSLPQTNTPSASAVATRASAATLLSNINTYKDNTHQMNNYNEIQAVNAYILQVNTQEKARLARTNDTLKSAILKERQRFMINERELQMGAFKCNVLILSTVILCFVFITVGLQLMQKLPSFISSAIIGILLLFYLFVTVMWMLNNKERRNINWNQYYWPNMEKKLKV